MIISLFLRLLCVNFSTINCGIVYYWSKYLEGHPSGVIRAPYKSETTIIEFLEGENRNDIDNIEISLVCSNILRRMYLKHRILVLSTPTLERAGKIDYVKIYLDEKIPQLYQIYKVRRNRPHAYVCEVPPDIQPNRSFLIPAKAFQVDQIRNAYPIFIKEIDGQNNNYLLVDVVIYGNGKKDDLKYAHSLYDMFDLSKLKREGTDPLGRKLGADSTLPLAEPPKPILIAEPRRRRKKIKEEDENEEGSSKCLDVTRKLCPSLKKIKDEDEDEEGSSKCLDVTRKLCPSLKK